MMCKYHDNTSELNDARLDCTKLFDQLQMLLWHSVVAHCGLGRTHLHGLGDRTSVHRFSPKSETKFVPVRLDMMTSSYCLLRAGVTHTWVVGSAWRRYTPVSPQCNVLCDHHKLPDVFQAAAKEQARGPLPKQLSTAVRLPDPADAAVATPTRST